MACWFSAYEDDYDCVLMFVGDKDVADYWCALRARGDLAGKPIEAFHHNYGGTGRSAQSTSGFSEGVWCHAAAVFVSENERHAYINGGSKGSNADAAGAVANHNRTAIGAARDSTPGSYTHGKIAEAGIWNVALTDAEITALASGVNPRYMRPANLKLYVPIWGNSDPEYDLSNNGINLALVNAPGKVDHAPVTLFSRKP